MATRTWPASLVPGSVDYAVEFDVQLSVMRDGHVQTYGLPGARWVCTLNFETQRERDQRPSLEALIMSLSGGAHRLSLHHIGRPVPNGTLRGSPILGTALAAGATSIAMANCNGGVKAGDILGLPGQFVMVLADANPVSTNMTVSVSPAIRSAHNSGTAVTWNKPTTLWIPRSSIAGPFPYLQNKIRPGFSIDLVEGY